MAGSYYVKKMSPNQLVGLFLVLVYLKDLALTLPHPGEPVLLLTPLFTLQMLLGPMVSPQSLHGLTKDKVSEEN